MSHQHRPPIEDDPHSTISNPVQKTPNQRQKRGGFRQHIIRSRRTKKLNKRNKKTNLVLQHVEQRRLPGIVETQEQNLGLLLPKAKRCQDPVEPVKKEHPFSQYRGARWDLFCGSFLAFPRTISKRKRERTGEGVVLGDLMKG